MARVPITSSASKPVIPYTSILNPLINSTIMGIDFLKSSGISSRFALYDSNSICLCVGPSTSKTTAMWLGFSLFKISNKVFVNPKIAEVLNPFELIRGLLLKAKYALYIKARASNKNNFFSVCFVIMIFFSPLNL